MLFLKKRGLVAWKVKSDQAHKLHVNQSLGKLKLIRQGIGLAWASLNFGLKEQTGKFPEF